MKKKPTVTIGIPTFNEESNIQKLLLNLLSQKHKYYILKSIIINDDGSTDKTESEVKFINDPRITFKKNSTRMGQPYRQNEILKMSNKGILIFLEADCLPVKLDLIDTLVKSCLRYPETMIVGGYMEVPPIHLFEKIYCKGNQIKMEVFKEWKKGENIYYLGGHSAKALSTTSFRKISIPLDVPEDAFIYLKCKQIGLGLKRISNANVYTGNISNFDDGVKQSNKFLNGQNSLGKYFPKKIIKTEYAIPIRIIFHRIAISLLESPFLTSLYLLQLFINRIYSYRPDFLNPKYEVYKSTKTLNIK